MGDDFYSGGSERRNKGKDKRRKNRAFPYRHGGKWRTEEANKVPSTIK